MENVPLVGISAVGGALLWGVVPHVLAFCCRQVLDRVGLGKSSTGYSKPSGIKEVNSSLWQFHAPTDIPAQADIIFFHGLQLGDYRTAYWKTWLTDDGTETIWPKEWLKMTFPGARVYSASYNSAAVRDNGQIPLRDLAKMLVDNIVLSNEGIGQSCPIILVGHSLGGIILKKFMLKVNSESHNNTEQTSRDRARIFIQNLKGVFYYGTPHGGSKIADWARRISFANTGQMVELLKTLESQTSSINSKFERFRHGESFRTGQCHLLPTKAVLETRQSSFKFKFLLFPTFTYRVKIVQTASGELFCDEAHHAGEANHFQVCRPKDQNSNIYTHLRDFISAKAGLDLVLVSSPSTELELLK